MKLKVQASRFQIRTKLIYAIAFGPLIPLWAWAVYAAIQHR
jgi:hypothetical protein